MRWAQILLALGLAAIAATALAQGEDYDFMPPGGRMILTRLMTGANGAALAEIAAREATAEEWRAWAAEHDPALGETALATFAGYAEINFPLPSERLAALAGSAEGEGLPADGKDLAIAQCQFCHALFSGYLMHRRDETGWRGTFKAPFHAEIPMSEVERDTFARYSALNMPLRFEDVPPELRF